MVLRFIKQIFGSGSKKNTRPSRRHNTPFLAHAEEKSTRKYDEKKNAIFDGDSTSMQMTKAAHDDFQQLSCSPPHASFLSRLFPGPNVGSSLDTAHTELWQQIQHKPKELERLFCTIPGAPMYQTGFPPFSSISPFTKHPDHLLPLSRRCDDPSRMKKTSHSQFLCPRKSGAQSSHLCDYTTSQLHYYDRYFLYNYTQGNFVLVDTLGDAISIASSGLSSGPCHCAVCHEWPSWRRSHDNVSVFDNETGTMSRRPPTCLTVFFWTFSAPEHLFLLYLLAFLLSFSREAAASLMRSNTGDIVKALPAANSPYHRSNAASYATLRCTSACCPCPRSEVPKRQSRSPLCSNHVNGTSIPNLKLEALIEASSLSSSSLSRSSAGQNCGCIDIDSVCIVRASSIFGLHTVMAYLVMQLVMTYDVTVFSLVCIGTVVGHACCQVYLPARRRRKAYQSLNGVS